MNNLIYLELIEAERRRDRMVEATQYRLVKEAKEQDKMLFVPRLLTWFGHLLEGWGIWLLERYDLEVFSTQNDQII